jgi:hypothetical protein
MVHPHLQFELRFGDAAALLVILIETFRLSPIRVETVSPVS